MQSDPTSDYARGPRNMKDWRQVVPWIGAAAIVAGLACYLYINADRYISLLHVSAGGALALFILSAAFPVFNGLINTYIFRVLGANLTHREGFVVAASSTLVNLLPVPGGVLTRAVYLRHRHGLDYSKYVSAQLAFFVCSLGAYGLVGFIVLLYWALLRNLTVPPVLFAVFGLMIASLLMFSLPLEYLAARTSKLVWLRQAIDGWLMVSKNPALLIQLLGLDGLALLFLAARYWFAFHMLSQDVTPSQVLLFGASSILTQLVTFAPGGLGIREAIVGGLASLLGFDPAVSVAALGLDWLVMIVVVLITGGLSMIYLGRQLSDAPSASTGPNEL